MISLPPDWVFVVLAFLGWLASLALLYWVNRLQQDVEDLEETATSLRSAKQSQSTRYGQISEQMAPLMDDWPFDPKDFRFLGSPVDGVQFTEEAIYLVEVKSASSRLSKRQRKVRDLVNEGKVGWMLFRVSEEGEADIHCPWREPTEVKV